MSFLDDIPPEISPFCRAAEIKRRAASLGFDWTNVDSLLAHAEDELREIREAVASGDKAAITDEMGDLLFVVANLARFTGTDADTALEKGVHKIRNPLPPPRTTAARTRPLSTKCRP